jgi:acetylornithine deacetylase
VHASIIAGGRELSVYPDRCVLQLERRTIAGESDRDTVGEMAAILDALADEDRAFDASCRLMFSRPPYELPPSHALPTRMCAAATAAGCRPTTVGMSFWTDAAVLAGAGIPSVLFGPGGAGLHSTEEYANVADVLTCRDALVRFVEEWI